MGARAARSGPATNWSNTAPAPSRQQAGRGEGYKDSAIDRIAASANVAQFISFEPGFTLVQRYSRVHGHRPNHVFRDAGEGVRVLLAASTASQVNIRSFDPGGIGGQEFIYGLASVDEVLSNLRRLAASGLYTLVNETIDVADGGVSGVTLGGLCEFAPGDTPRAVEKEGTASLPAPLATRLLSSVYGFQVDFPFQAGTRVEFSLHPLQQGFRREHMIVWEITKGKTRTLQAEVAWPNKFSRLIGDKAFGLLIADCLGLRVPLTRVIGRSVPPFEFGRSSGTAETWIRTCPVEPEPGRFSTFRGWVDPFKLLQREDPDGSHLSSVLAQEGVDARYSGASATTKDGDVLIEGVTGFGDRFMTGSAAPHDLPESVIQAVRRLHRAASSRLGDVSIEWAHDGKRAWVLQLHKRTIPSAGRTIVPGKASKYHVFNVDKGLETLRALVESLAHSGEGVILVGNIGLTSHFGDLLRRAGVPSLLRPPSSRGG